MSGLKKAFKKLVKIKDEFEQEPTGITEVFEKDFSVEQMGELKVKGDMGAGSLIIKPQPEDVDEVKVKCEYRKKMPNIEFNKIGEQAKLQISQQSHTGTWKNAKQKWTIYLPKRIQTDMKLHLGAGSNTLDFGDIDLKGLEIHAGVGSCDIDFTKQYPKFDKVPIEFENGVGNIDVRLSEDLPARVKCSKGIGSFSGKSDLISTGEERFATKGFDNDKPYFDFKMSLGVGNVDWITEKIPS